jgi:hypothetical protein
MQHGIRGTAVSRFLPDARIAICTEGRKGGGEIPELSSEVELHSLILSVGLSPASSSLAHGLTGSLRTLILGETKLGTS